MSVIDLTPLTLADAIALTPNELDSWRKMSPSEHRRFWAKVVEDPAFFYHGTFCWVWTASLNRDGYGQFRGKGCGIVDRVSVAHKFAWEELLGPVPAGLVLDHLCGHPEHGAGRRCLNPAHLQPVTVLENTLRGQRYAA